MTARDKEAEAGAGRPGRRTGPARRVSVGLALAGLALAELALIGLALIGTTMPLAARPARPDLPTARLSGESPASGTASGESPTPDTSITVAASRRRPIPPWIFGRGAEPRLVPPRAIPGGRPGTRAGTAPGGASAKATAPLPRTRPDRPGEPTGTAPSRTMPPRAPGAVTVPIAPLE